MTDICLFLVNNPDDQHDVEEWINQLESIKLIKMPVTEIREDILKHAAMVCIEHDEINDSVAQTLHARVQLYFFSTLVLQSSTARPFEKQLSHLAFQLNQKNLSEWISQVQARIGDPIYATDSLVSSWKLDLLSHLKTDHFQMRTAHYYAQETLVSPSFTDKESLKSFAVNLHNLEQVSLGAKVDLFLTLRSQGCYQEMLDLYESLHIVEQELDLFKEQYVFAANRLAISIKAKEKLVELLDTVHKKTAETQALKGRVYKDCWKINLKRKGNAEQHLDLAIDAYRCGAHLDIRDGYPAINLATLLRIRGRESDIFEMRKVLNNVEYSLMVSSDAFDLTKGQLFNSSGFRRTADYWDTATVFEMAVLNGNYDDAMQLIEKLIALHSEQWMLDTTLNNLTLLMQNSDQAFVSFLAPVYFTFKGKVELISQ
ncbi:MAG: TRAFs-binding domain-containing protein [Colwellia sp.]|jgi:hypothetical protein